MKVLIFVDLHGDMEELSRIKDKAKDKDIELIICAGDLTLFEKKLDLILFELNKIDKPILIIHGNHETENDVENICSLFDHTIFLHKKTHEVGHHMFIGYGGGGFDIEDSEFRSHAKKIKKKIKKNHKVVLITHAPPHGTKVDYLRKEHKGNKDIRLFIEDVQPVLVVCGHFHENAGTEDMIGRTRIINPGQRGKIVDV